MQVLGIDPSSSSSGHALVRGDEMIAHGVWKPTTAEQKIGGATRMYSYYTWLYGWIGLRRPAIDMAVIEELGVMRGAKTARVLAHFEAVACIVCKRHGLIVVRVKAGVARNLVLGMNPNSKKEEVLVEVRKQYPNLKFPPKNQGGEDVADAFVMAKAGPAAADS
jgi:Holliday junction resolvasome RuvABC endonuclease subunit